MSRGGGCRGLLWLVHKNPSSFENMCVKHPAVTLGYANAQPPDHDKICDCPTPGLTAWANDPLLPGGGVGHGHRWNWLMQKSYTPCDVNCTNWHVLNAHGMLHILTRVSKLRSWRKNLYALVRSPNSKITNQRIIGFNILKWKSWQKIYFIGTLKGSPILNKAKLLTSYIENILSFCTMYAWWA